MSYARLARRFAAWRVFRALCFLWVLLVPVGQVLRFPYLGPARRGAIWSLSGGVLTLAWAAAALSSGVVPLGYRGMRERALARSEAPRTFWANLAITAMAGIVLVAFGIVFLMRGTRAG